MSGDPDRTDDWQESLVRGVQRFYAWTDKRRVTRWPMKGLTVWTYVLMTWMIVESLTLRYLAGAFLVFVIGADLWSGTGGAVNVPRATNPNHSTRHER